MTRDSLHDQPDRAFIRLRQEADGWWWSYVEPGAGLELLGNRPFESRRAAMRSAATAYPGVPVLGASDPTPRTSIEAERGFPVRALLIGLGVGVVLVAIMWSIPSGDRRPAGG